MLDVVAVGTPPVAVGTSDVMPEFGTAARPEHGGAVWTSADGLAWERVADEAEVHSGPGLSTDLGAAVSDGATAWAFGVDNGSFSDALAAWSTGNGTDGRG